MFNPALGRMTVVDGKRDAVRYVPASTFKIANSLIALETGDVKDENEVIPYGGNAQDIKSWEKDMSMRDAAPISNVPIYQELARRIGLQNYATWLAKLDYGKLQTGTALERFWLDGPLAISAIEQTRFVARLAQGDLPMSARSQAAVRDILKLESKDGRTLYGKTGWSQKIGWWTGWVDDNGKITSSALNMDMPNVAVEQLIAELAKRQPVGVSAPVNPMADACNESEAASRAVAAVSMIECAVNGPETYRLTAL